MAYLTNRAFHLLRNIAHAYRYRNVPVEFEVELPMAQMKRILNKHNLGYDEKGNPSWWYSSLRNKRNNQDDLTRGVLRFIRSNVAKDARVLGTGCGTGWMLFWLAQKGFKNLHGFDYLPNVVAAANEIARENKIDVKIWQDDAFNPKVALQTYDAILVLYWIYSAWAGNYGNKSAADEDRVDLLRRFLVIYVPHLAPSGRLIIELIDAVADLREPPLDIYPIRHSRDQVQEVASDLGLTIEKMMFNCNHGHQPRMLYVLRRNSEHGGTQH